MMSTFYSVMRFTYRHGLGSQHMLHYPLYTRDGQSLMEGQARFSDACVAPLQPLAGTDLVDIGCGNGVQTLYVHRSCNPGTTRGVDLDAPNIASALEGGAGVRGLSFSVDDAQTLATIPDASADRVLCTESAHHYPDKAAFLRSVFRILRPGGKFVIAELVLRDGVALRRIDGLLAMHHWDMQTYRAAIAAAGLRLESEVELTDGLVRGFESSSPWFEMPTSSSRLARAAARTIGRGLVSLYRWELRHRYHYKVLAGTRP